MDGELRKADDGIGVQKHSLDAKGAQKEAKFRKEIFASFAFCFA